MFLAVEISSKSELLVLVGDWSSGFSHDRPKSLLYSTGNLFYLFSVLQRIEQRGHICIWNRSVGEFVFVELYRFIIEHFTYSPAVNTAKCLLQKDTKTTKERPSLKLI